MAITVLIPTPLQKLTNGEGLVTVEGSTVAEVVDNLEAKYAGFKGRVCDDSGRLRRFVNVYLNNEDIRFSENEATPTQDGDELSIVPAIAGG